VILPRTLTLPGGYRIRIRYVPKRELMDPRTGEASDGEWDVGTMTLRLRRGIPKRRALYVFAHELVHAVHDYSHHLQNEGTARA
jgi:hypothetical protein